MKSILVAVNAVDDLLIDELGGDRVKARVVPRREQLLAVHEAPRRARFHAALTASQLLTLADRVHDVVESAAERRHLHTTTLAT